ncbi:putative prolyl 4-hydroxylase 9 [Vitis vinifera]|uniref:Putative prolyl 4-hydroxylase 9 n=1 Tax=Vitis vinifera TaxID=29760 RepID=A0A438D3M2_VITVI|nr:putative prolyl 4-hydroxylase 9 [Vitis vinifera]
MESSNIFPTFLQVNASLLNRRGTPAIAISSIPETKNSGEQAESARKFEETVDERQRWLEPQVRIAASLPLMVPFLPRWPLWVHAVLSVQSRSFLQDVNGVRSPPRLLESVEEEYSSMPHGETGESSVDLIPFQVLSWKPRARYFPHFATAEQCQSIIEMAKSGLSPSTLVLRKGETEESTKGIRTSSYFIGNSSGTFISASEDKTGILDFIERKIAKATMIPRNHGEVCFL